MSFKNICADARCNSSIVYENIQPAEIIFYSQQEASAVSSAGNISLDIDGGSAVLPLSLIHIYIGLPDGDGFNVVDWLRQHESLAQLPLVVYSGRDLSPAERRNLTLGPTHFLAKARVQPQQLEALVLTMLRSSRQMEEASTEL